MNASQNIAISSERTSDLVADALGNELRAETDLARAGARRAQRAMMRVAVVVALAMSLSASAHARPDPPPRGPSYSAYNYRQIASDDHFRKNYNHWKRSFPKFDWTHNGCSAPNIPVVRGYSAKFFWPCVQHDFAYRNNRKVKLHNTATRRYVDRQLLVHMKRTCASESGPAKVACLGAAETFYGAVYVKGGEYW